MKEQDLPALITRLGQQAKHASRELTVASDREKARALRSMAKQLEAQKAWLQD